jgi:hypothetical protein
MESPDIRIPRPPKHSPKPQPTPANARPVTVGDLYRSLAKPDLDEILIALLRAQQQLNRQLLLVGVGLGCLLLLATFCTWSDLAQIRSHLPQQPPLRLKCCRPRSSPPNPTAASAYGL